MRPAECGGRDTLCLKVPYPRFENPGEEGVALVMSTAMTEEPVVQGLGIRAVEGEGERVDRTYNLHDLWWRLDHVGEFGRFLFYLCGGWWWRWWWRWLLFWSGREGGSVQCS